MDFDYTPTDFVAVFNQTLEVAYPAVSVVGEVTEFRISRGRWVFFSLKDEFASLRCFAPVAMLPGPIEDGMMVRVRGAPRLHQSYGFSLNIQTIQPFGTGSLKRAQELLRAKLAAEGLFDSQRKRGLPYAPVRIGLITAKNSAAYADFMKVLGERWAGLDISFVDAAVQGEDAPAQLIAALETLNGLDIPPEVIVMTRGGGSEDDLYAFNTEQVTRAVAASRAPTIVAVGHEVDFSLAELAADVRASTPSNAAQLLTPDKVFEASSLRETKRLLQLMLEDTVVRQAETLQLLTVRMGEVWVNFLDKETSLLSAHISLLKALNPKDILRRGYALVSANGTFIKSTEALHKGAVIDLHFADGTAEASVTKTGMIR